MSIVSQPAYSGRFVPSCSAAVIAGVVLAWGLPSLLGDAVEHETLASRLHGGLSKVRV